MRFARRTLRRQVPISSASPRSTVLVTRPWRILRRNSSRDSPNRSAISPDSRIKSPFGSRSIYIALPQADDAEGGTDSAPHLRSTTSIEIAETVLRFRDAYLCARENGQNAPALAQSLWPVALS